MSPCRCTAPGLNIEEVGHNCWVLEVYLLSILVPLQQLQLFNIEHQYGNTLDVTQEHAVDVALRSGT